MSDQLPPPQPARRLSEEEKARAEELYGRFGQQVVQEVRQLLRQSTQRRTAASPSAVANSVWASVFDHHLDKVDLSDEQNAWRFLLMAAQRHCEAWNRYGTRHPQVSLDAGASSFTLADPRAMPALVDVLVRECSELFASLGPPDRETARATVAGDESALRLVLLLNERERNVFALKLTGHARPQVATLLRISLSQVDSAWEAVQVKAAKLATDPIR